VSEIGRRRTFHQDKCGRKYFFRHVAGASDLPGLDAARGDKVGLCDLVAIPTMGAPRLVDRGVVQIGKFIFV
jgi:hypothetical protein